jgi:hypothetical protein
VISESRCFAEVTDNLLLNSSGAVDILGRTFHWGSTCCFVPSDCDQNIHPLFSNAIIPTLNLSLSLSLSLRLNYLANKNNTGSTLVRYNCFCSVGG